jgi:hypothetical protein
MLKNIINKIIIFISTILSILYLVLFLKDKNYTMALACIAILLSPLLIVILEKIKKRKLFFSIKVTYLFMMLIASLLGSVINLYEIIPIYDNIVHFISGILISWCAYDIFNHYNKNYNKIFRIMFIISFSFAIAGIWEIYEYTYDSIFHTQFQLGLDDTMKDIIAATAGCIIYLMINKKICE